MKCPFKFGRYGFEGSEECDAECAWRIRTVRDADGELERLAVCAVAFSASDCQLPHGIENWAEED